VCGFPLTAPDGINPNRRLRPICSVVAVPLGRERRKKSSTACPHPRNHKSTITAATAIGGRTANEARQHAFARRPLARDIV
jgi:hypothetical protein